MLVIILNVAKPCRKGPARTEVPKHMSSGCSPTVVAMAAKV